MSELKPISDMTRPYGQGGVGLTESEMYQKNVDSFNRQSGELTGYQCPKCHNKGFIMDYDEYGYKVRPCSCEKVRQSLRKIEKSGIKPLLERYTLAKYQCNTQWQKNAKDLAIRFLDDFSGKWFFAGGQSGSGKSHICTAIVGELLQKGHAAYYMTWRDESVKLKAIINDEAYSKTIDELKNMEVLYIDDLFKGTVSKADINLAFQILNYRYINNLTTVISSELNLSAITQVDEAIAGRILEKARGYTLIIPKDSAKNYRRNFSKEKQPE